MSEQVKLTIDGKAITASADTTILQAALDNGIYIPHLCSHENLHPTGSCRMCLVGVEGESQPVTSCVTKVRAGMVVNTHDELCDKIRKLSCDFMFKTHPSECTGCPKYGKCQLASISQYVGDTGRKLKANTISVAANTENPIILHEMYRCILCGRCVRACNELRGVGAIKFAKVNGREQVVIDGETLKDADCRFCTACVEVCPTGSIREHPEITAKLEGRPREEAFVPCRAECPAHIDVPRYIRLVKLGEYAAANAVVREKVPFPHALGYICVHSCENECKHHYLNEPISIRNLKRYAAANDDGSWRSRSRRASADTGKRIAVVGAGPAGLTLAWYGAKKGHSVTVFDAGIKLGGQLRYGIPGYRLPRDILDEEIGEIITDPRVTVKCGTRIEKPAALLEQGFDAVFVAVGTHDGVRLPLKGNDLEGVLVNAAFLRDFEDGVAKVGKRVVVLGGGNVAMDCAGAAYRLGAEEVHMACLEAYDAMTATDEERAWAVEEGVKLYNSRTFNEIYGEDGHVTGIQIMQVGNFRKENGRMMFDKLEGTEETIPCDTIIFATGQRPEIPMDGSFGLELTHGNYIATTGPDGATSVPGVWAAGDAVTGTQSVIKAIAGARNAIIAIDKYLGGDGDIEESLTDKGKGDPFIGRIDGFGELPREEPRVVPVPERVENYTSCGPMDQGFDRDRAWKEAMRCLQCDLRCDLKPQKFWNDYTTGKEGEGA